jgi:hypothetical protein
LQPGWDELPPAVQQACRALQLDEPPLACRQTETGGWVIIAADGRKFYWQPEQTP